MARKPDDSFIDVVLAKAESLPEHKPDLNAVVSAVKKLYGIGDDSLRRQGQEQILIEGSDKETGCFFPPHTAVSEKQPIPFSLPIVNNK
jgi:hypothetical protein